HSYTFTVYRATDGFPLENLLLSLRPDGSYRAFLVEYALPGEETEALFGGAPVDLDGKVSFVPIDAGALVADVFSKVTTCGVYTYYDCWETACPEDGCWDPILGPSAAVLWGTTTTVEMWARAPTRAMRAVPVAARALEATAGQVSQTRT